MKAYLVPAASRHVIADLLWQVEDYLHGGVLYVLTEILIVTIVLRVRDASRIAELVSIPAGPARSRGVRL